MVLNGKNTKIISGLVKADIKIVRIVSGLSLPISCYLADGNYVGSCVYNDLCSVIKSVLSLSPENCPQSLIDNDIPCVCPWNLPIRALDINAEFDLIDATTSSISWIATGDFNVDIKGTQGTTSILCMNVKFSTNKKPSG